VVKLTGWNPENNEYLIKVLNCYNTVGYPKTKKPVCYGMSAKLAALFEIVHNKKAECMETRCAAKGDPYCEFRIRLRDEQPGLIQKPRSVQEKNKKYWEAHILFNKIKGEIFFENDNCTIIPRGETPHIKKEFEDMIGTTAHTISYNAGKRASKETLNNYQKGLIKIIALTSKKKLSQQMLKQIPKRGFGKAQMIDFSEEKDFIKFRVTNSMEAQDYEDSEIPECSILTGVIAGAGEIVFNRVMDCIETRCAAMGDPYCEFELYRKKAVEERLQQILHDFVMAGDVEGALIMSKNGILIASCLPPEINAERLAMIASTITGATEKSTSELGRERFYRITVETGEAGLIIRKSGKGSELIVITKPDASLGFVFNEMRIISDKLREAMQ